MGSNYQGSDRSSIWLLVDMNVGFFGLQVANALQTTNVSAIFESLGAVPSQLPLLWLGAPVIGFLTQALVGHWSDRTWTRWGRRQPFFLGGATLGTVLLLALIQANTLWQAALLYWLLQLALNINSAPTRPFVGDVLPLNQHTLGYGIQGFCIGAGAILASALPWLTEHVFNLDISREMGIPSSIQWAYIIGAAALLSTTLWTFYRVNEPSPKSLYSDHSTAHEHFSSENISPEHAIEQNQQPFWHTFGEAIIQMPLIMRKLAWVQVFTWAGMYCIFLYLPTAIAFNVLGASNRQSPEYVHGVEWAGICIAFYNLVCLVTSLLIPMLSHALGRVTTHTLCLMCGGLGLISLLFMHDRYPILLAMLGIGIAWASILSIPYAILVDDLDENQRGIYMGLFNCFVTLPQIAISLGFGWLMNTFLQGNRVWAIALGGLSMGIAALLMLRVTDPKPTSISNSEVEVSSKNLVEETLVD